MLRMAPAIFLIVLSLGIGTIGPAKADELGRARAAFSKGDYVLAANILSPLAIRGNSRAQMLLGFFYENGFGVPQAYEIAVDLYQRAAVQGNPDAQSRLGLMYDKGHGISQNVILAYKWLDLAAAHAPKSERDYYIRLRNAVASKMSSRQIVEGQRRASSWAPGRS